MIISKHLYNFYDWWQHDGRYTLQGYGLCSALYQWYKKRRDEGAILNYDSLEREQILLFHSKGLDIHHPFNDSLISFSQESMTKLSYLNKKRVAFVEDVLDNADTLE